MRSDSCISFSVFEMVRFRKWFLMFIIIIITDTVRMSKRRVVLIFCFSSAQHFFPVHSFFFPWCECIYLNIVVLFFFCVFRQIEMLFPFSLARNKRPNALFAVYFFCYGPMSTSWPIGRTISSFFTNKLLVCFFCLSSHSFIRSSYLTQKSSNWLACSIIILR